MTYTTEQIKEMLPVNDWINRFGDIDIGDGCYAHCDYPEEANFIAVAPAIVRQLLEKIEEQDYKIKILTSRPMNARARAS